MANISFKQYRAIDLCILSVVLAVCEGAASLAASSWFPGELYALSPTVTMVCIVMMRWSGYAAIPAAVGGLVFCIASGATPQQFAVYCAGNCLSLIALIFFRIAGKEKVRASVPMTLGFVVTAFCGAQIGRWLISLIFGSAPDSIFMFFTADSLSLLFAAVVVLISRRLDGIFEDQKSYLIRTEEERRREQLE